MRQGDIVGQLTRDEACELRNWTTLLVQAVNPGVQSPLPARWEQQRMETLRDYLTQASKPKMSRGDEDCCCGVD